MQQARPNVVPLRSAPVQKDDAERLLAQLSVAMQALGETLEKETALIASGRIREGLACEAKKAELSAAYMVALQGCKANIVTLARFAPEQLASFRAAQAAFELIVEHNLAVLGTARAVSEGLMKSLAEETERARRPVGYGAPQAPPPAAARATPLVFSGRF